MKFTWLGQAGLYFENENIKILVDPYLSNSCYKLNEKQYRRVEVNNDMFNLKPDVIVITHNHQDHLDNETLEHYLNNERSITVLAPYNAWCDVRKFGGNHNYVMFNAHTIFTVLNTEFKAFKAEHSDLTAIGFSFTSENRKFYISGDTLYNIDVINDVEKNTDFAFMPINGVGNNMNMADAVKFADDINTKTFVPIHWGMFDELNPNDCKFKNKLIPQIYKEIEL